MLKYLFSLILLVFSTYGQNSTINVASSNLTTLKFNALYATNLNSLRSIPTTNISRYIIVGGRLTENDGGGGIFVWNSSSTTATNLGTIFQNTSLSSNGRFERVYKQLGANINVLWFGVQPNVVSDQTAAIDAARNFCGNGVLYFPGSVTTNYYYFNFNTQGYCNIVGDDDRVTVFRGITADKTIPILTVAGVAPNHNKHFYKNFAIDGQLLYNTCIELGSDTLATDASRITLDHLWLYQSVTNNINLRSATACDLLHVTSEDSKGYGIYISPSRSVTNLRMQNCSFRNNYHGIHIESGDEIDIQSSVCESNLRTGIYAIRQAAQGPKEVVIENLHMENNGYNPGIYGASTNANDIADIYVDCVATYGQTNQANWIVRNSTIGSAGTNVYNFSLNDGQSFWVKQCKLTGTNYGGFSTNKLRFQVSNNSVFALFEECGQQNYSGGFVQGIPTPAVYANWPTLVTNGTTSTRGLAGLVYEYKYKGVKQSNANIFGSLVDPDATVPASVGQLYVNTSSSSNNKLFVARGPSTNDWVGMLDSREGTWLPYVVGSTNLGTSTISIQFGRYLKTGKNVQVFGRLGYSGHTGTGQMILTNLPFQAETAPGVGYPMFFNLQDLKHTNQVGGLVGSQDTFAAIREYPSGTGAQPVILELNATNATIDFYLMYRSQ